MDGEDTKGYRRLRDSQIVGGEEEKRVVLTMAMGMGKIERSLVLICAHLCSLVLTRAVLVDALATLALFPASGCMGTLV